jgi:hypothetical protein
VLYSQLAYGQEDDPDGRARRIQELETVQRAQRAARGATRAPDGLPGWDVHRHFGFYFRPDLGLGYMAVRSSEKRTWTGAAGFFGLHVGGAVHENVILGVHLYDGVIAGAKDSEATGDANASPTTITLIGFGPELTYYFMPANAYISATVSRSRLTMTTGGESDATQYGLGGRLALGQEWWVSRHWGLGLVAHASYASNKERDSDPVTLKTWGFGLALSATYN